MAKIARPVSIYQPNKESIGKLLSMTEPSIVVPDWQRNYSWKSEQIDTFWFDLTTFFIRQGDDPKGEYFLGSVVIVNTEDGTLKLLDGQQRLATSAIFLSVIRDQALTFNRNAGEQLQREYLVGYDHVENNVVHKLRLNIYDRDFFRQLILDDRDNDYNEPEPKISSHYLIQNARRKLEKYITEFIDGLSEKDAFEKYMKLSRCLLQQMTVIAVSTSDEESAADVFETLNDRGIGLSTPDLLRNLIIRRAAEGAEDTVVELWRDLVSFENDVLIQNFLRHYWVSRYGDVKTKSLYREIKGVIIDKNLDSVELSTSLNQSSETYRQITRADTSSPKLNQLLSEILGYGSRARILLPALLALIEELGVEEAIKPSHIVHNVFVRHSIILKLENSPLENALYNAARELRNKCGVGQFVDMVLKIWPDDEKIESAFSSLILTHNGSRRNLLKRLEIQKRGTEELDIANPERVHVEHVYPQKPLDGEKMDNHDKIVNRLGNLTLLSARLNKAIQNGAFAAKKPELAKSELMLTKEIAESNSWGKTEIENRQKRLAKLAPGLWPIL